MNAARKRCRASLATALQDASVLVRCFLLFSTMIAVSASGASGTGAQPVRGGTMRVIQQADFRSLDPAIAFDLESLPFTRLLFRGLLEYDDGVNLVPGQASDWNISPDGKTYTFHLKPGVKFANGREVEAADYVFSFERILNPATDSPGQGYFTDIDGASDFAAGKTNHVSGLSAPDQRTFIIRLQKPLYTFRYVVAMTFATVVPRDIVQQYGSNFLDHLIGSGPYKLAEWRRGIRWRLVRNPYYTGPDGYVDAFDIQIVADNSTATMMLERNETDRVKPGPAEAIMFERDPRRRSWLVGVPSVGTDYIFMNTEMKPFDNPLVRQAVNYAINKRRINGLTGGFTTVANGIVPPEMSWTNTGLPHYDYDPEKARALLREAGYPDGFKTTFLYEQENDLFGRMAAGIQQDLQQVGIDVSLRPANFTAFDLAATTRHQTPFGIWGWYQDYPDPSDFLDVLFNGRYITDTDCNNTTFYNNSAVNALLDRATSIVDENERIRLFKQAEDQIMQDAPWAPLDHEIIPELFSPRVHGTQPHPVWLWRYEWMWLDPQ